MKTKIKRHSRSVISVILAICMLISCMTAAIIATDAAKVESESVGYSLQDGARIYFDASKSGFTGSNVYVGFLYNKSGSDWWDCYVMKMSHVSNSKIYTIETYDVSNSSCDDLFFFSSNTDYGTQRYNNNAQWSWDEAKIYQNITTNKADGGYSLTGGWNVYNYHTYYYSCTSATPGAAVTQESDLTGSSASDENKSPYKYNIFKHDQSANVYLGTDYVGDSNTTVGGRIQMAGRFWNGKYSVSDQGNASSGSATTYRTYSNAARGTTAEASVLETFSGYSFDGWYNSSNELLSTNTTYSYTVTGANTIRARFSVDAAYDYFVTSAGSTDDTAGFTSTPWVANDSNGGMSASSETDYDYEKTFTNVPVGTYRFKITDGTWLHNWGDNGSIDYDDAPQTANQGKENNGNAKFDLTAAANVTIYFNPSSGNIKVKTTAATVPDKYYIVGQASDGTRGMFYNVWGENWTSFNSADEVTFSGDTGTKAYTDFRGTTGTYTYKVIKVTSSGIAQYYPESGDGLTVDITGRTTSVTFTVTKSDGAITAVSTSKTEGAAATGWQPSDPSESNYTTSNMYVCWGNNDQFSDSSHRGSVTAYKNSGSTAWWADLTSIVSGHSNFYFYWSSSDTPSYSGNYNAGSVQGSSSNTVNGGTGGNVNYNGTKMFTTALNSNNDISGGKKYVHISGIDSSVTNIGVIMTNTNGTVNYQIYYKTTSGSETVTTLDTVDIYAKNGTLRDDTFNRFTNLANTDVISITDPDGIVHTSSDWGAATGTWSSSAGTWTQDESGYGSNYDVITKVPVGSKVKLRTYLSNSTASGVQYYQSGKSFADTHYLKAYSINGMTYQLHKASEATSVTSGYKFVSGDQYYEEEWTVEAINTTNMKNGNTVEITPIYYMKDNSNCKTFYIDGYIGDLQTNWGTMLCVYPYYSGKSNKANAFGGYPGQPMLYWGGKYQMEVPLTVDGTASGAQVQGLTMHNGYWDLLHRALDTKCDDGHCQTYDYDDFYKLYKEKNADTIYYWFKYETTHDNYNDGYEYTTYDFVNDKDDYDTGGIQVGSSTDDKKKTTIARVEAANGAEIVTDYYHRQVDIFGTLLPSDSRTSYTTGTSGLTGNELLIVSDGYKDTYVGEYGTIWAVYTQDSTKGNFTFLGYISSSMLYLNSINSVNNYTGGTNTGNGKMSWSEFTSTYNTLKASYTGKPVLISYEKEIWNDSKDKANRSDGKWYYSMGNDKINANIRIEYTDTTTATLMDTGVTWTTDTQSVAGYAGENNVGATTGCSAYFTNTTPSYLVGKTSATDILVDNEKYFTFQANSGGEYVFVGWVRECGGEKNAISSINGLGQSNISANDTYIARFRKAASGSLVVSHNIFKGTYDGTTYKGDGTKYLKVQVYDGSTLKKEYVSTDGTDINVSDYIKETNDSYTIKVTLTTVPDEDCTVELRTCSPDNSNYKTAAITTPTAGLTQTQTKEFTVGTVRTGDDKTTAIRYYTYLTKTAMTYNYSIVYHYTSRFWGDQSYTVSGNNINELYSDQYFTGVKSGARLTDEFIKTSTPYEKNFRQTIDWNYTSTAKSYTVNGTPKTASAMTKGNTSGGENIYNLTAEVWASNSVDDSVKAEFLLPYKYNADTSKGANDRDKSAVALPVYTAADGTTTGESAYAFDEDSYESFTITSKVGRLFQWDGTIEDNPAQASDHADDYNLIEAAPYILYKNYEGGVHQTVDFHYKKVSNKRYYTGNSFTVNGITYYKSVEDMGGQSQDATHVVLTRSNTVTVNKPEKAGQAGYDGTTYEFAVKDNSTNAVYFFAYAMNSDDQMVDNTGALTTTPVFNGQYIIYTENDVIDGIVKNGDGENFGYSKKYFTRWDIFNSKGEKVASSYYRQFNYSGYENYTIKPIYAYDTPSAAAEASEGLTASISYLGDSRNQWKEPGTTVSNPPAGGTYNSTTGMNDATYAGDKIFTDFAIAYNYNDQQINKIASSTEQIKIGMVIEKLNPVQMVGDKAITDPEYYAGLAAYNQYDVSDMQNYILSKVAEGHSYSGRPNSHDKIYSGSAGSSYGATHVAIGTNENGFSGTSNLTGNTGTIIDNKNRLQYFYTFTKSRNDFENLSTTDGNVRPYDCVYRVSSYIYVNDGTEKIVVSAPVYFTLYDIATR